MKGRVMYIFYCVLIWTFIKLYHFQAAVYRLYLRCMFKVCEKKPKYWAKTWKANGMQDVWCAKYGSKLRKLAAKRDFEYLKRFDY